MLSPKRLMKKAASSVERRRIVSILDSTTEKGHFVVYTVDHVRFMMPLSYLENQLFQELLRMSQEEFGTSSEGPITLPCDAVSLDYMVLLIKRGVTQDVEIKPMLDSVVATSSSSTCYNFSANSCIGPKMIKCDHC